MEDFLVSLYPRVPQLARVGFTLCKATKLRPVIGTSVAELRLEMNRSQLFIRPQRDLMPLVCTFNSTSLMVVVAVGQCVSVELLSCTAFWFLVFMTCHMFRYLAFYIVSYKCNMQVPCITVV